MSGADDEELAALREAAMQDPEVPEPVRRFLGAGARLDSLRLDERGVWSFNGAPVEHPRVRALFARSIARTGAGTWVLRVPPYTYPILVERTGRFVDRLRVPDAGSDGEPVAGRLSSGEWTTLDLDTLRTDGHDFVGVQVEGMEARLIDAAYRELAEALGQDERGWYVTLGGRVHRIACDADADASP